MTNLTAATARTYELGDLTAIPAKAASPIFEGSAIGVTAGYARTLVAGDRFVGFAINDLLAQAADGDANAQLRTRGRMVLPITGVAVADVGKPVYASDGNTFTLTQNTN